MNTLFRKPIPEKPKEIGNNKRNWKDPSGSFENEVKKRSGWGNALIWLIPTEIRVNWDDKGEK